MKQQLEPDMEQQIDYKLRKEYIKAAYCHPAYLTFMQSTSWETLGWMKHKLELSLLKEISADEQKYLIHADGTNLIVENKELNSLLMKVKQVSEKVGLKFNTGRLRPWHPVPLLHEK